MASGFSNIYNFRVGTNIHKEEFPKSSTDILQATACQDIICPHAERCREVSAPARDQSCSGVSYNHNRL